MIYVYGLIAWFLIGTIATLLFGRTIRALREQMAHKDWWPGE